MHIGQVVRELASSGALQNAGAQAGIEPDRAHDAVHAILSHFAQGGAAQDVIGAVCARTGLDPAQVEAFLPRIMPLPQSHAQNAPEGGQGVLGGLMGSLGGLFGSR